MAQVKFIYTDAAKYGALAAKDAGTLYFLSDTKQIFKGAERFSGLVCQEVTADPAVKDAVVNTLYINTTDGSVKIFNGTALTTVVAGYVHLLQEQVPLLTVLALKPLSITLLVKSVISMLEN